MDTGSVAGRMGLAGKRTGLPRKGAGGVRLAVLAVAATLAGCGSETGEGRPVLDTVPGQEVRLPPRGMAWVIFGSDTVRAEVARTPEQRARGLMYRDELPEGTGMLFVFEDLAPRSFWMRNTYIPLDIAFLDTDRRIVDIQQMQPLDERFTDSAAPAMFALEVPQGWFARKGIGVGAVAVFVFGAG